VQPSRLPCHGFRSPGVTLSRVSFCLCFSIARVTQGTNGGRRVAKQRNDVEMYEGRRRFSERIITIYRITHAKLTALKFQKAPLKGPTLKGTSKVTALKVPERKDF
jgi:hypothetical protein